MTDKKKSAKVIALTSNHLPTGDTPETIKALLRYLSEKAGRGEIVGMAVSWVEPQNDVCFQIAQGHSSNSSLVSAVTALFYEINLRWSGR